MSQEKKHTTQSPKVKLSNLFGISPLIYIPILYALVFLLLLSWLLITVFFKNTGEYINVQSIPKHAAVFVDDTYVGSTPITFLQEKGQHTLTVHLPYYDDIVLQQSAKARGILRRIFPKKIQTTLFPSSYTPSDNNSLVSYTISTLASWNITNSQTHRYINKPIFSNTISNLLELLDTVSKNPEYNAELQNILPLLYDLLYESMSYITIPNDKTSTVNKEEYELFHKRFNMWTKGFETITQYPNIVDAHPKKIALLQVFNESLSPLQKNANDKANKATQKTTNTITIQSPIPSTPSTANINLQGIDFYPVSAHNLLFKEIPLEGAAPLDPIQYYMEYVRDTTSSHYYFEDSIELQVNVLPFHIMANEITQGQFAAFLKDKGMDISQWKEKMESFVSQDHVDRYFLDYDPLNYPSRLLRYITWYDAKEYVTWFNEQLQKNYPQNKYLAKLPNEFEWYSALQSYPRRGTFDQLPDYIPQQSTSPVLLGNLWEWGDTWFSPSPQFAQFEGPRFGSEKQLFGGSFVTKTNEIPNSKQVIPVEYSRNNSYPPNWATPYVGFRMIIITQ